MLKVFLTFTFSNEIHYDLILLHILSRNLFQDIIVLLGKECANIFQTTIHRIRTILSLVV